MQFDVIILSAAFCLVQREVQKTTDCVDVV